MRIIKAAGIADINVPLVIAGPNGWLTKQLRRDIVQIQEENGSFLRRFRFTPREQLMCLLKGAKALVFPSLYEGFGLPVLEAMMLGVPVITSNVSSMPEVGGNAPLYVDPYSINEIARAMEIFAGDDQARHQAIARGKNQAKKFSPENHLQRIMDGYEMALNGSCL
jgi:glycosyltransferase involved in cell wall biosynthesis